MTSGKKKAIIFDFGNVIALFDYDRVVRNFAALSSNALSPKELRNQLFGSNLLGEFEVGNIAEPDFVKEVKQRLKLNDVPEEEIADIWCDLFTPNEEVINTIKKIPAEIALVLGSTTNPIHFKYYREEFSGTLNRFEVLRRKHLKLQPTQSSRCD